MENPFDAFLSAYTPAIQNLILQTRALIVEVIPDAIEQVDPPSRIIAYGYSSRNKDLICAITPYRTYLNLMFSQGAQLPDPEGLLEGTGKLARHIKIGAPERLAEPGVRRMIEIARQAIRPETR
jgi:hypothetical protein